MVLPFVPFLNAEDSSLMDSGDLGVAVMVLATRLVESLSGVKPTLRTLSLKTRSGTRRRENRETESLPDGHEFDNVTFQPSVGSVGTDIHPFSLLELHQVHEEPAESVETICETRKVANLQGDKDGAIASIELV